MPDHIPVLADDVPCLFEFGKVFNHLLLIPIAPFEDAQPSADSDRVAPVSDELHGCAALQRLKEDKAPGAALHLSEQDIQ